MKDRLDRVVDEGYIRFRQNYGQILDYQATFEGLRGNARLRRAVSEHLKETNVPTYDNFIGMVFSDFGIRNLLELESEENGYQDVDPDLKSLNFFIGLEKVGKTSAIEGIGVELNDNFKRAGRGLIRPKRLFHRFERLQELAEEIGLVKAKLGSWSNVDYLATSLFDVKLLDALCASPGQVYVLIEYIGYTQNFDKNGKSIGTPRGDLREIKKIIRKQDELEKLGFPRKLSANVVSLTTNEVFRRSKLDFWHSMGSKPSDEIEKEEKEKGIVSRRKDLEKYEWTTPKTHQNHMYDIASIIRTYIDQEAYLGGYEEIFGPLSVEEIRESILENPEIMNNIQKHLTAFIAKRLFPECGGLDLRFREIRNSPLLEGTEISGSLDLQEKDDMIRYLRGYGIVTDEQLERWVTQIKSLLKIK